jgi:hypothetical protein
MQQVVCNMAQVGIMQPRNPHLRWVLNHQPASSSRASHIDPPFYLSSWCSLFKLQVCNFLLPCYAVCCDFCANTMFVYLFSHLVCRDVRVLLMLFTYVYVVDAISLDVYKSLNGTTTRTPLIEQKLHFIPEYHSSPQ